MSFSDSENKRWGSLIMFMAGIFSLAYAQMPACVSISPPDATAWDELTLTFDPSLSCFQSQSLEGFPVVYMHSGVGYPDGSIWQHVVAYNETGANGQSPILIPNGDGTYSITYTPSDFYGLPPGTVVSQLCMGVNSDRVSSIRIGILSSFQFMMSMFLSYLMIIWMAFIQ
jgi:hypothetical protein